MTVTRPIEEPKAASPALPSARAFEGVKAAEVARTSRHPSGQGRTGASVKADRSRFTWRR